MNRMLPFALAGFWIALLAPVRGMEAAETAETLVVKIRSEIGPGWNVSYHKGTGLLTVESVEAMRILTPLPPGAPLGSAPRSTTAKFSFTLRTFPLVSAAEYSERVKRNATRQHRRAELESALRQQGVPYQDKPGEFRPRTDAEKQAVEEWRRLQSPEELPDFFFGEISLSWVEGSETAALDVADPAAQRECDLAIRKTLALLSKYPGGGGLIRARLHAR